MAFDPISAVLSIGEKIIDRVVPDKNAARVAKEELARMEHAGELSIIAGQLEINKIEAGHSSIFVAGWRPAVGWICAFALGYHFIAAPFMDIWIDVPIVEVETLYPILMGMLGLSGMRSFEKAKDVNGDFFMD